MNSQKKVAIAVIGESAPEIGRLSTIIPRAGWEIQFFPTISDLPSRDKFQADISILTSQYNWFRLSQEEKSRLGTHTFWFVPSKIWAELESFLRDKIFSFRSRDTFHQEQNSSESGESFELFPKELFTSETPSWEILFRIWKYIQLRDLIISLRLGVPTDDTGTPLWDLYPGLDWATGLDNRSRFFRELKHYISYSQRYKRPFCCMIFSIDNYRELESSVKLEEFQLFLQDLAGWLELNVREADLIARVAEGQFGFILPETGAKQGEIVLGRLLTRVGDFIDEFYPSLKVKFSAGISEFSGESTPDTLLKKAFLNRREKV